MGEHVNLTAGQVVGGRFRIEAKLGQGGFGSVYRALGLHTGDRHALKVERGERNVMLKELLVMSDVGGKGRVGPAATEWWRLGNNSVLTMEVKGRNVQGVNNSLASIGLLMVSVLTLLGKLHHYGYVHRDIKASNIVFGNPYDPEDVHTLYLVDFGLSDRYRGPNGEHLLHRDGVRPKGTFQYLSIWSHKQVLQSRRDDLESLAYMAGKLLKGRLPWVFMPKKLRKHSVAALIKEQRTDMIFSSCPEVFADFLQYVRGLEYDEEPDYEAWSFAFMNLAFQHDPDGHHLRKCREDVYPSQHRLNPPL